MKRLVVTIALVLAATLTATHCSQPAENQKSHKTPANVEETTTETNQVVVYYFHSKQRCKTCLAVQAVTQTTISENFAENENITFLEVDFTEASNEKLADKYQIASSSLIIVKGDKYETLTDIAFANAVRNPQVLKDAIVTTLNKFLSETTDNE